MTRATCETCNGCGKIVYVEGEPVAATAREALGRVRRPCANCFGTGWIDITPERPVPPVQPVEPWKHNCPAHQYVQWQRTTPFCADCGKQAPQPETFDSISDHAAMAVMEALRAAKFQGASGLVTAVKIIVRDAMLAVSRLPRPPEKP